MHTHCNRVLTKTIFILDVDFFSICITERWKTKIESEEVLLLIIAVFSWREDEGGGGMGKKTRTSVKYLFMVYSIIAKIMHKNFWRTELFI